MSSGLKSAADLTLRQPRGGGEGMDVQLLYLCGHKGRQGGGKFRIVPGQQRIPLRCAACQIAKESA